MHIASKPIQVYDGDGVKLTLVKPPVEKTLKMEGGRIHIEMLHYRIGVSYNIKNFFHERSSTLVSHNIAVNGPGFGGSFSSHNHQQWAKEEGWDDCYPKISYVKLGTKRVRVSLWHLTENLLRTLVMHQFGAILYQQAMHAKKYGKKRVR